MRHHRIAAVFAVLALSLLASACYDETTPNPTAQPAPTSAPAATANPTPIIVSPPAPAQPTPVVVATPQPAPTSAPAPAGIKLGTRTFPSGSVLFHSNRWTQGQADDTDLYAVIFDPSQSGVAGRNPMGWWYQPLLPSGPQRISHDVAIVLQPGVYDYTGPECIAYFNADGNSPWEKGQILVNRENREVNVPPTTGKNESWVGVKCRASEASGFSFSRLR